MVFKPIKIYTIFQCFLTINWIWFSNFGCSGLKNLYFLLMYFLFFCHDDTYDLGKICSIQNVISVPLYALYQIITLIHNLSLHKTSQFPSLHLWQTEYFSNVQNMKTHNCSMSVISATNITVLTTAESIWYNPICDAYSFTSLHRAGRCQEG